MPENYISAFRSFGELNDRGPSNTQGGRAVSSRKSAAEREMDSLKALKTEAETVGIKMRLTSGLYAGTDKALNPKEYYTTGYKQIKKHFPDIELPTYEEFKQSRADGTFDEYKYIRDAEDRFVAKEVANVGFSEEQWRELDPAVRNQIMELYRERLDDIAAGEGNAEDFIFTRGEVGRILDAYEKRMTNQQQGGSQGGSRFGDFFRRLVN